MSSDDSFTEGYEDVSDYQSEDFSEDDSYVERIQQAETSLPIGHDRQSLHPISIEVTTCHGQEATTMMSSLESDLAATRMSSPRDPLAQPPNGILCDDTEIHDSLWEKPAWAKGGVKLRKTGKAKAMKATGNLASPITFTPFKSDDHSNPVANRTQLRTSDIGEAVQMGESLAAPITFTPFKNYEPTNYTANPDKLRSTEVGNFVKSGGDLALPITHTRNVKKKDRPIKSAAGAGSESQASPSG